jgi:hypothetical protein
MQVPAADPAADDDMDLGDAEDVTAADGAAAAGADAGAGDTDSQAATSVFECKAGSAGGADVVAHRQVVHVCAGLTLRLPYQQLKKHLLTDYRRVAYRWMVRFYPAASKAQDRTSVLPALLYAHLDPSRMHCCML